MSPFKSEAQRRFMYSQHPEMAKDWERETPEGVPLPEHMNHAVKHGERAQRAVDKVHGKRWKRG